MSEELGEIIIQQNRDIELLKGLRERFCTKSNGLSIFFRADWKPIDKIYPKLEDLYNFQCKVEDILEDI